MNKNTNFIGAKITSITTWSDQWTDDDCVQASNIIIEKDGKKYKIRGEVIGGEGVVIQELGGKLEKML